MAVNTNNPMQAPITAAKGRGSCGKGTDEWISQHVTVIGMIPLVLFLLASFIACVTFGDGSYETAHAWVHAPWNGGALLVLIVAAFYHGAHAMQSGLIEDYVHDPLLNVLGMMGIKFAAIAIATAGLLAILKIMLGA